MLSLRTDIAATGYNIRLYITEALVAGDVYCCVHVVSITACDLGQNNTFFHNMKTENNAMISALDIFCTSVSFRYQHVQMESAIAEDTWNEHCINNKSHNVLYIFKLPDWDKIPYESTIVEGKGWVCPKKA